MKLKLKIMNIFYFVISAVAIVFLSITPLFKSTIVCHVDKNVISQCVEEGDIDEESFEEFGITKDDLFVGDLEFDINVEITVDIATAFAAIGTNSESLVNNMILGPVIEPLAEELEPVLTQIAMNGITASIRNIFEAELQKVVGANTDLYGALQAKNFTKKMVDKSVDNIVDEATSYGQSLKIAGEVFKDEFDVYAAEFGGSTKTSDDFYYAMVNPLNYLGIADDGSVISIEDSICSILQSFLGDRGGNLSKDEDDDDEDEDEDDEEQRAPHNDFVHRLFAPLTEGNEPMKSGLAKSLLALIGANFFEEGYNRVRAFCAIGVILLLLFAAGWIVKIINLLICLFRKTPYLRVEPFGITTGIIQLGFAIATIVFIVMFELGPVKATQVPIFGGIYRKVPLNAYYKIEFGTLIPGAMVILNGLLSLVYNPVKKRFKTETKKEAESFLDIE